MRVSFSGTFVISSILLKIFCSNAKTFFVLARNVAASTSGACFLKLGESLRHWTTPLKWKNVKISCVELLSFGCKLVANADFKLYNTYLVSPTLSTGYCRLKDRWFNPVCFVMVTFWLHIAWYLSNFKSNTCTLPSKVEAANTVLEYGAQAMSVTWESRSNIKRGLLENLGYKDINI